MTPEDWITLWNTAPELAIIIGAVLAIRHVWRWAAQRDAENAALVKALNESFVQLVREAVGEFRTVGASSVANGEALAEIQRTAEQNAKGIALLTEQLRGLYDAIGHRGTSRADSGKHE